MTYISSPFSDGDYSTNTWTSADFDISSMNPDNDANLEYSLNWDETRTANGNYIEFRVDITDVNGAPLISDIKKKPNGDPATFTLTSSNIKFIIKTYVHKSFAVNAKISNFKFNNKINIIVDDGYKMLMDVMAYDNPNYTTVSTLRLGGEQPFYNKSFTAGDFDPKEIGEESPIYDNPNIVWEDLYDTIPFTANTTATMDTANNKIYVFGETNDFAVIDLNNNTWTTLASLTSTGYTPIASEFYDGNVYYMVYNGTVNKIYKYDVAGNSHTLLQTVSSNTRTEGDSVLYNDKMYVMGGDQGLSNILAYDITSDAISTISCTLTSGDKFGGKCALSNKKIYFFGGSDTSNTYIYDIVNDSWNVGTDMPEVKKYFGCATTKNKYQGKEDIIYIFNGKNSTHNAMNSVQAYNTLNDTWATKHDTSFENSDLTTVTDGFYTYNVGGNLDKIWRYEPEPVTCIVGGYGYGQQDYGTGVYSDLQDRNRIGTCRIGSTDSTTLYTKYTGATSTEIIDNKVTVYSDWLSNDGTKTVNINSIGFFNQDATRQLFSYSKLNFEYDPAYEYRIKATFSIEGVNTQKSTTMDTANNGFLDRLFNGPYVSDYTYISKFLAGENSGYFTNLSNTMSSENYGPTEFKAVTIDTGAISLTGTGNMTSADGNGSDYDSFAMVCEEPGDTTEDNALGFTGPSLPFLGTGSATLTYPGTSVDGVLGRKYSLAVDINSLLVEYTIASGSSTGKVELVSWDGSAWNVEEVLTANLSTDCVVSYKLKMDKAVYGIGLKFTDIAGDISVDNVFHAGNKRQMAFATKINNTISKTSDYNILVDMVEKLQ